MGFVSFSDPHYWWINMAELKDQVEAEMTRYRALQDGACARSWPRLRLRD